MQEASRKPLILASASPRRRELLQGAGVPFEVVESGVDENGEESGSPAELAKALARKKALAVAARFPGRFVLGADTIVVVDGAVLGKPSGPDEARRMLSLLSGRSHIVVTGFCLVREPEGDILCDSAATEVWFKDLSEPEINWYLKTGEPYDKAGGYAIQGHGCFMVSRISGSYTNVVGLPLAETLALLYRTGAFSRNGRQGQ
ncbi:MAG: Maf family protein [Thermodesulfobacteriota bacterium]